MACQVRDCPTVIMSAMITQTHFIHLLVLLAMAEPCLSQEQKLFASFIELPWRYVIGGNSSGKWLDSETADKRLIGRKYSRKRCVICWPADAFPSPR